MQTATAAVIMSFFTIVVREKRLTENGFVFLDVSDKGAESPWKETITRGCIS